MMNQKTNKDSISFHVSRLPLSLNTLFGMHWAERHKEGELWDLAIFPYWLSKQKKIFIKPVRILYSLGFEKKRPRDLDNYIGGTKFITDALKKTFLLRDDADALTSIAVDFKNPKPGTTVIIEEV